MNLGPLTRTVFHRLLAAAALVLAACGHDEHGDESPDVEACEHLQGGPPAPVTAVTPRGETAPAVAGDHKRYDITLVDVAGGKGGSVQLAATEATDYLLFLDADVPLRIVDTGGNDVTPEEKVTSSVECSEIAARYTVPLNVGTFYLELGPTTATQVSLVIEEAGHAH